MQKNDIIKTKITATSKQEGLRLDVFLAQHLTSRTQAEKFLKQSFVKDKSGKVIHKASYRIKSGDSFTLQYPTKKQASKKLKPYNVLIPILFEDSHILVINKPAGIVSHPSIGHEQDSLINALIGKTILKGGNAALRQGIIHRLDKNVSGLMILSKSTIAYEELLKQFQSRTIKRIYRCIVYSKSILSEKRQKIESFIGRHPLDRKKFYSFDKHKKSIPPHAKNACTYYQMIHLHAKNIYELKCQIMTGRTHQIRVHLASQGLWIIGDSIYFPKKSKANTHPINGMALYAANLSFIHPVYKNKLNFSLPWPKNLQDFIQHLKSVKEIL